MRLHLFSHIVVLLTDLHCGCPLSVFRIDETGTFMKHILFLSEQVHIVVPYYIRECGLLYCPVESYDVQEAFVSFRIFRPLLDRQHCVQLHPDQN